MRRASLSVTHWYKKRPSPIKRFCHLEAFCRIYKAVPFLVVLSDAVPVVRAKP
jgi:hypothetical protein